MKEKIFVFLCVAVILFFGSCADLSTDDEEAVKADLPTDFDWQVYGEINGDVLMSQIVLELKKTKRGEDSAANCAKVLNDMDFAKEVYKDYLQCPVDGWDRKEKCTGKYANNSNYGKPIAAIDTIITQIPDPDDPDATIPDSTFNPYTALCTIENCWSGGWSGLQVFLPDSLAKYSETSKTGLGLIKSICQFIPENSTSVAAKSYLNNFNFNSYLVEQHYHFFGRSDGRPYKYCDAGHGAEKNQSLHAVRREGRVTFYYDYGGYTFCLDKTDQKIYVAQ